MASPSIRFQVHPLPVPLDCDLCCQRLKETGVGHRLDERTSHLFHKACAEQWLNAHSHCPICEMAVEPLPQAPAEVSAAERCFQRLLLKIQHGIRLQDAARAGDDNTVTLLLSLDIPILDNDRGSAVEAAAEMGHGSIVEKLLANQAQIPAHSRGLALLGAIKHKHPDLAQQLLNNQPSLLSAHRKEALFDAAAAGYHALVESLLLLGDSIAPSIRGIAIYRATANNCEEVVRTLFRGNGISIETLALLSSVCKAIENQNLPILQILLADGRRLPRNQYDLIRGAAVGAPQEMCDFLEQHMQNE